MPVKVYFQKPRTRKSRVFERRRLGMGLNKIYSVSFSFLASLGVFWRGSGGSCFACDI